MNKNIGTNNHYGHNKSYFIGYFLFLSLVGLNTKPTPVVRYWEKLLSFPEGVNIGHLHVNLPKPCERELQRIRLYDTINIDQIFVLVSELQENPGQWYCPPAEVSKSCCRKIRKSCERPNIARYFYSFVESEGQKEAVKPRLVAQMDAERSIIYQKNCLGYDYDKPVQIRGDIRIIFYEKLIGGHLFYACFNTTFISSSLLQFSLRGLDKVGKKGRSICGSSFCLELFFGPSKAKCSLVPSSNA